MMAKALVEKFKEDFKMNFEQDDHICPYEMLSWLEDNA
jgi:ribosomal protein S17E